VVITGCLVDKDEPPGCQKPRALQGRREGPNGREELVFSGELAQPDVRQALVIAATPVRVP
jgi:hypothetical protein